MNQTIRALGWATYILWLVLIVFTVTAVYSASQLGIDLGEEPETIIIGGTASFLLPFTIVNRGFYDITDLNITTTIRETNGTLVSNATTPVPLIASGGRTSATHNLSVSLTNLASASLARLLFNDTNLNIDLSLGLRYARVIPLSVSTNMPMPWGAPLSNLTIGFPTVSPYNSTHIRAIVPISFENHSFFTLTGTIRAELMNTLNQRVGSSTIPINVPSQSGYSSSVEMLVPVSSASSLKEVRLYFDTSVFDYGPVVVPIG